MLSREIFLVNRVASCNYVCFAYVSIFGALLFLYLALDTIITSITKKLDHFSQNHFSSYSVYSYNDNVKFKFNNFITTGLLNDEVYVLTLTAQRSGYLILNLAFCFFFFFVIRPSSKRLTYQFLLVYENTD